MPTYEFRCPDGTIIERMFRISEVPQEIPVPDGEGMATRIISGGASLLFKGSGFYITDYGKDGKKDQRAASESKGGDSSSSSASDSSASSSGSTASESKPSGDKASGDRKSSGDRKPSGDGKPSVDSKPASAASPSKPE